MQFININYPEQKVTFPEAVVTGLGKGQGLFFPEKLLPLDNIQALLDMDFVSRSTVILQHLVGDAMAPEVLRHCVENAFNFPLQLKQVSAGVHAGHEERNAQRCGPGRRRRGKACDRIVI